MKKFLKYFLILITLLTVVYFVGPKPNHPKYDVTLPTINVSTNKLDSFVAKEESSFSIKPDNECRIIWADSTKQKTGFSILYLPGFTASQAEADPIHKNIAKKFGCNLYLARLYGHGLKDTLHALEDLTVDKYWETAKAAFAIAKKLGDKVIIMSTSTGGTLSLKLAAEYDDIAAQVMLSPNIALADGNAWLLNDHWGKQIAKMVKGGETFYSTRQDSIYKNYWTHRYHVNGAVQLEELIESSMVNGVFKKVTEPLCLLYYYKDEQHQDNVVSVPAMKKMYELVATPTNVKQQYAIPNAENHVIGSYIQSKDIVTVEEKITTFLTSILGLKNK
jgi:esterase/lipase